RDCVGACVRWHARGLEGPSLAMRSASAAAVPPRSRPFFREATTPHPRLVSSPAGGASLVCSHSVSSAFLLRSAAGKPCHSNCGTRPCAGPCAWALLIALASAWHGPQAENVPGEPRLTPSITHARSWREAARGRVTLWRHSIQLADL